MLLDLPTSNEPLSERMRLIRFRMKREHLRFRDELKLVPKSLLVVLGILFVLAEAVAFVISQLNIGPDEGPIEPVAQFGGFWGTAAVCGIAAGMVLALSAVLCLIGYVNRDAARRGMNSMLWTLFVIVLMPAFLLTGFIVYFLVREPLPYHCPKCGTPVTARFNFCPGCKYVLHPTCAQCKREVGDLDRFCTYCGNDLADPASASALPPGS